MSERPIDGVPAQADVDRVVERAISLLGPAYDAADQAQAARLRQYAAEALGGKARPDA